MFELIVESDFAAAHRLREYHGNCERLHGHNWRVEVRVAAPGVDAHGMVLDFREVKRHLTAVLGEFDHQYLNDLPAFRALNPTTEHIARTISEALAQRLPAGVAVRSVAVWESPGCGAVYTPE